jgi:hypothetical protein
VTNATDAAASADCEMFTEAPAGAVTPTSDGSSAESGSPYLPGALTGG